MAYALIIIACSFALLRKSPPAGFIVRPAAWFLFIFAGVSFAAWEYMFAIYRYILPLELLSPLLIVLAIGCLPLPRKPAAIAAIVILIVAQCFISTGWNRKPWGHAYVAVDMSAIPVDATILMTGNAPMGYVVPSLPNTLPVLRIGSYLADGTRFADELHRRVAASDGPFLALFAPGDETATMQTLADYGLSGDFDRCAAVTSNIAGPLRLCPGAPQMKVIRHFIHSHFFKFGIVGTGGYLVDVAILKAMIALGMSAYYGQIPALFLRGRFLPGLSTGCGRFATGAGGMHIGKEWLRYLGVTIGGFCVNYAAYSTMVTIGGLWARHVALPVRGGDRSRAWRSTFRCRST